MSRRISKQEDSKGVAKHAHTHTLYEVPKISVHAKRPSNGDLQLRAKKKSLSGLLSGGKHILNGGSSYEKGKREISKIVTMKNHQGPDNH